METLDLSRLAEAGKQARSRGIPLIGFLEDTCGLAPDRLMTELGRLLRMPVLAMEGLRILSPAFDVLSFSEAVKHECALFRSGEQYILAVGNPFSPHLRAWLDDRIEVSPVWHLVHPADLSAYFTQQEQTMRAMDSVLPRAERGATQADGEDLSLKTINEGTSPVVRLVHSTLYDAHKSQASDIHLEMVPGALSIKYRIDGVLTAIGVPTFELSQDAMRYFDYHHTPDDTLDKVDPAQLRQNVAAWTAVLAVLSGGIEEPKGGKRR